MANITGNIQTTVAGAITTGTADVFIPEIWSSEALEAVEFAAVIQKRVDRHFQAQLNVGDTLNIPRLSNMTANNKTPGSDVTFEAITETSQTVTAAIHKYAALLLEDLVGIQANQDLRGPYTKKIGYALNRAIETNLSGLFASLSTSVGTLNVELVTDDYLTGWTDLANAGLLEDNPNPGEDFSIILTPAAYAAAMKVDVFTNSLYNKKADSVGSMSVGDIYGFPVFISNLLTSNGGGHDCVMFFRGCYALIIPQDIKIDSDHLIWKMGDAVVGSVVFGAAEMNFPPETAGGGGAVDNRGVWLKTV